MITLFKCMHNNVHVYVVFISLSFAYTKQGVVLYLAQLYIYISYSFKFLWSNLFMNYTEITKIFAPKTSLQHPYVQGLTL